MFVPLVLSVLVFPPAVLADLQHPGDHSLARHVCCAPLLWSDCSGAVPSPAARPDTRLHHPPSHCRNHKPLSVHYDQLFNMIFLHFQIFNYLKVRRLELWMDEPVVAGALRFLI